MTLYLVIHDTVQPIALVRVHCAPPYPVSPSNAARPERVPGGPRWQTRFRYPAWGLKLAGVGRLLDAGIRLASPPPREPLGEEQAERRDEREDLRHHVRGDGDGVGRVAAAGQRPEPE